MKSTKTLLAIFGLAVSVLCEAQINYQAVVRDSENIPQVNQTIDIDVTITQDGTTIYSEQHSSVGTGELGIVNLAIGSIDPTGFNELDWSLNNYEVQMSIDSEALPSTPIRSVPIAEYAKNSRWNFVDEDSSINYSAGPVGIGTSTPVAPIHIAEMNDVTLEEGGGLILGETNDIHLSIDENEIMAKDGVGQASQLLLQHDGGNVEIHGGMGFSNRFSFSSDGHFGIGTPTPQARLHLVVPGVSQGIRLQANGLSEFIQIHMASGQDDIEGYGYLQLGGGTYLRGNGRTSEFDGKVEVECLQINGGCDITEPFESKAEFIEPGTVVVMTENGIVPSSTEYDNRVVGVVSGANGINKGMSLSQSELFDNGIDIAIAGRVYVKTAGDVQIGDLLVSSDIKGVAQAENDISKAFGKSIGKALSIPDENGYVLMIVNLL